jgi:hypothetical protein
MKEFVAYLDRVLEPLDPEERDELLVEKEPVDDGVENICLEDLNVVYKPKYLKDHLPVFGRPKDIKEIHNKHPEHLNAERAEGGCGEPDCSNCSKSATDPRDEGEDKKNR